MACKGGRQGGTESCYLHVVRQIITQFLYTSFKATDMVHMLESLPISLSFITIKAMKLSVWITRDSVTVRELEEELKIVLTFTKTDMHSFWTWGSSTKILLEPSLPFSQPATVKAALWHSVLQDFCKNTDKHLSAVKYSLCLTLVSRSTIGLRNIGRNLLKRKIISRKLLLSRPNKSATGPSWYPTTQTIYNSRGLTMQGQFKSFTNLVMKI